MRETKHRKRLVLGVTGSIASYKAAEIARHFMKRGYSVRVVMTESASRFISPLTFQSLTGNPVNTSLWSEHQPGAIGHIELADWTDVILVAPATADCVAKLAFGFAESNLLAVVLATKAPVVIAPAMNVNMYENPQTQENLESLRARGMFIVEPDSGDLACGWKGRGRLAACSEIFFEVERAIGPRDLVGKRVLISAGPTREAIDPVRFLSNRSSGKMGIAMAREAFRRGANVTLVHGPLSFKPMLPSAVKRHPVTTAEEMRQTILNSVYSSSGEPGQDIIVKAAAVADFRPRQGAQQKLKKSGGVPEIELVPNPDILAELGSKRGDSPRPLLVGFAVETQGEAPLIEEARAKLSKKGADFIIANLAQDSFDRDTNRVWVVSRENVVELQQSSKNKISRGIWDQIIVGVV
jgi:phosphopantothenoylcysteine decarboxylase/phosphopantothenate--cysteine ligase